MVEKVKPRRVASGMLRLGLSITPAATDALSTPMKAHKANVADVVTALRVGRLCGFQLPMNTAGSNQNQPNRAIRISGNRETIVDGLVSAPTNRGPMTLARTATEIRRTPAIVARNGARSAGKNSVT